MIRTFGPSGYRDNDGTIRLSCVSASTRCFLLNPNGTCRDQEPERKVDDIRNTPEWCKYAQPMREDIVEMEDFERMGLTRLGRADLMKLMKDVPTEYRAAVNGRAFTLTEHNAAMMRAAIRRFRLAADGGGGVAR